MHLVMHSPPQPTPQRIKFALSFTRTFTLGSHDLGERECRTNLPEISHEHDIHVARVSHNSHIVSLVQHNLIAVMSQHLTELGSLPNPAADDHSRYQSRPTLSHELREATYESDDLSLGAIVKWVGSSLLTML